MTEKDALKLMAEIGPNAKDAIDSWVALQWFDCTAGWLTLVVLAMCAVIFIKKLMASAEQPDDEISKDQLDDLIRIRKLEKELDEINKE